MHHSNILKRFCDNCARSGWKWDLHLHMSNLSNVKHVYLWSVREQSSLWHPHHWILKISIARKYVNCSYGFGTSFFPGQILASCLIKYITCDFILTFHLFKVTNCSTVFINIKKRPSCCFKWYLTTKKK